LSFLLPPIRCKVLPFHWLSPYLSLLGNIDWKACLASGKSSWTLGEVFLGNPSYRE
jgi:hypothetical protein